jgi:hypothetical protein
MTELDDVSASEVVDDEHRRLDRVLIEDRTLDMNMLVNVLPHNVARAVASSMIIKFGPSVVARLPFDDRRGGRCPASVVVVVVAVVVDVRANNSLRSSQ